MGEAGSAKAAGGATSSILAGRPAARTVISLRPRTLPKGSENVASSVLRRWPTFFDFFPMEWVAEFLAAHPRV